MRDAGAWDLRSGIQDRGAVAWDGKTARSSDGNNRPALSRSDLFEFGKTARSSDGNNRPALTTTINLIQHNCRSQESCDRSNKAINSIL